DNTTQHADSGPSSSAFDVAQEIIQNLENKIKTLSSQAENYRQAIVSKENIIRDLGLQLELHAKNAQDIDHEYVQTHAKQGMEILDRIKSYQAPSDLTGEVQRLKIENMSLKNIVDELAMRIRQDRASG
ncbi:uncharacterized protein VICG_01584, partial [Vittaforma corneae ATCC 50505]